MRHIFGCVSKSKLRVPPKTSKNPAFWLHFEDFIRGFTSTQLGCEGRNCNVGSSLVKPLIRGGLNGWWRDVAGWDLLRISGSSWMKPVTCTYLPSIFLFGKVIFTLLGQLGKSLSWRWKVGEKCPKWVETLVTLAYPNHLHYRCYLQRSTKLLCKGITTLGSTYKIGGSPS